MTLGRKNSYVTSHAVKFTHPPDGRCHFSQDGKIKTMVRNPATPLDGRTQHIFSVHVAGLEHFREDKRLRRDAALVAIGEPATDLERELERIEEEFS